MATIRIGDIYQYLDYDQYLIVINKTNTHAIGQNINDLSFISHKMQDLFVQVLHKERLIPRYKFVFNINDLSQVDSRILESEFWDIFVRFASSHCFAVGNWIFNNKIIVMYDNFQNVNVILNIGKFSSAVSCVGENLPIAIEHCLNITKELLLEK